MYLSICLHVCLCAMCLPGVHRRHKMVSIPDTGVTDGCELLRGWWERNSGLQQEKQVLVITKPSVQLWFAGSLLVKNPWNNEIDFFIVFSMWGPWVSFIGCCWSWLCNRCQKAPDHQGLPLLHGLGQSSADCAVITESHDLFDGRGGFLEHRSSSVASSQILAHPRKRDINPL